MRRQYFYWAYLVLSVILTVYGTYSIVYSLNHQKDIPLLAIVFVSIGATLLVLFAVLYLISVFQKKKRRINHQIIEAEDDDKDEPEPIEEIEEKPQQEEIEEPELEEQIEDSEPEVVDDDDDEEVIYERPRTTIFRGGSAYVSRVGYGPVLRVSGPEILDMRNNTYYHIEGNMVNRDGSGPVFEISGNRIRAAFGSYLYEISGSSVNKVFGGFYASINGNSIQVHDLSDRYEISGSLNLYQQLAVVALLFGAY